ncbi:MAG TPA: hypothetical protein VF744_14905 [Beijerinckiaceae bacterium]|jgi:hypothetical protein
MGNRSDLAPASRDRPAKCSSGRPAAVATILLAALALCGGAASAAEPVRLNCDAPHQRSMDLAPIGAGPLALPAVYCQRIRATPYPKSAPLISPDARAIAYYEDTTTLRVAELADRDGWTDHGIGVTFSRFGSDFRSVPSFAWDTHSRFLWAAAQERVHPSGFAKTPLQAVNAVRSGGVQLLPALAHPAGPLDGLLWANGDGLAVAQFGTRGGFYRPEHADPSPTFGIVDARRGAVLDTLPFAAVEPLRERLGTSPYVQVRNAAATTLADGRVRAFLNVGQWLVWTQGEPPRLIADPYSGEQHARIAISPDGTRLLVARLLRTEGGWCDRRRGCAPGKPVEGVLAALHDLADGRALWTIRATVEHDYEYPTPAIGPDGRFALVGLVPAGAPPEIGLVAMDTGAVVQRLPAPGGPYAMGFAQGGRTVWTHAHGLTALYEVAASP